jgi:hypothetical protein
MRNFLLACVAALLFGCAGNPSAAFYGIPPGTPRADVTAKMGRPTAVVPLPDNGERLQYSLQPYGRYAYMVDLDSSGKVVRAGQVLTEANFQLIQPGTWTRADVEREFGPPAWTDRVASFPGTVMTYRWRDTANADMFYYIYVDSDNVVRRAHPGIEWINAPNDRN